MRDSIIRMPRIVALVEDVGKAWKELVGKKYKVIVTPDENAWEINKVPQVERVTIVANLKEVHAMASYLIEIMTGE